MGLEIGVRLAASVSPTGPGFFLKPSPPTPGLLHVKDPDLEYLLSPERDRSGGYGFETAPLRILCIGNSNVWGQYVREEESFPYRLYQMLRESGVQAFVVNAGVPGHRARNIRRHLEYEWKKRSYNVVVFTAGWNDLHASVLTPRLRALTAHGPPPGWMGRIGILRLADGLLERLLPHLLAPDRWDETVLDAAMLEIEKIVRFSRNRGALVLAVDLPCSLAPDGGSEVHGSAEPVVYPPVRRFSPAAYRRLFEALSRRYRETLERMGVPIVKSGLEYEVPWKEKKFLIFDQCHPSREGHRRIAEAIQKALTAGRSEVQGLMPSVERVRSQHLSGGVRKTRDGSTSARNQKPPANSASN